MTGDIPVMNGGCSCSGSAQPVGYKKNEGERYVLVITNDSTVFTTKRWVSAEEMFAGRMTEVKNLVSSLSEVSSVSFGIISGKYGFIPSNYVVMPYDNVPECKEDYEELQNRTDYAGKIEFVTRGFFDRIVVCVPKDMFALIKDSLPDDKVIAVTNPCYEEECSRRGWTYLHRNGARVGNENAKRIREIVESL